MEKIVEKEHCSGCYACFSICPRQCIRFEQDDEGFYYPEIDNALCVDCGMCKSVCPRLNPYEGKEPRKVYAAKSKSADVLKASSSGGLFSVFADYVISLGGVVFGAELDEKLQCVHGEAATLSEYTKFRGSKYVQSQIGRTFLACRQYLEENNRPVLFTGSPCQIMGLKSFLKNDYPNLLCVDFLCHGVPSQKMLDLFVKDLEKNYKGKIKTLKFREKVDNWRQLPLTITFQDNQKETICDYYYYRAFLKNLFLRPACHRCMANQFRSGSDITIADYWEIETKFPDFDKEQQGASLMFVNSKKGERVACQIENKLKLAETSLKHAEKFQYSIRNSSIKNPNREAFFDKLNKGGEFAYLVDKYCPYSYTDRLKRLLGPKRISWVKKIIYFGYRWGR